MAKEDLIYTRETLVLDAAKHVWMAREQRKLFVVKKAEAQATLLLPATKRTCTFVADYSQNCCVLCFAGEQPGETYYYSPMTTYVFGVADCVYQRTIMSVYAYLEIESGKGGNNLATMLWKEFCRKGLWELNTRPAPVKEINLVFDNRGGQNKHRMVLSYCTTWCHGSYARLLEQSFWSAATQKMIAIGCSI